MTYELPSMWIFGYGSLIWNPGFEFADSQRAYAIGWVRRMYQGNVHHRGDKKLPGRVATIVEAENQLANGVAFRVDGQKAILNAFNYLYQREVENGYSFRMVPVELEESTFVTALTFVANVDYDFYLGPDDPHKMARDILNARGCAGPNCEYVLKLAENVRKLFPDDDDEHLYQLETIIRAQFLTV